MSIRFSLYGDQVLVEFWGDHFLDYKVIMKSLGFPRFDWDQKAWTFPISLFKRITPILATLPETPELSRGLYQRLIDDQITLKKAMKIREVKELSFQPEGFKGKLLTFQQIGASFLVEGKRVVLGDDVGLGKAQPLDAKLVTPQGLKRMGDINLGDEIFGVDGKPHKVTGVFPQGRKEIYRVTFSDKSSTECCNDHLWSVQNSTDRTRGCGYKVLDLRTIQPSLFRKNGQRKHFIRLTKPVEFSKKSLPCDPYLLGALLGDGGLSIKKQVRFHTADMEMLDLLLPLLPAGLHFQKLCSSCSYGITQGRRVRTPNPLCKMIVDMGLAGRRSEHKFIPEIYKYSSVEDRIAIFQGLMDTDGSVATVDNHLEYSSSSEELSKDMVFLVQSLGGVAKRTPKPTACLLSYRVSIALPNKIKPFRLSRKAKTYRLRSKYPPARAIVNVKKLGKEECQCISVDSPGNLYLTDNFIATHNTVETLGALYHLFETGEIESALIVSPGHLKRQWEKEIEKFTYCASILVEGDRKKRAWLLQQETQIFITNYELLTRDPEYLAREWGVIIFDEAQEIKNWQTQAAKLSRKMISDYKWALTATPLENSLPELHSIVEFVAPAVLGQWSEFERMYVIRNIWGQIEGSRNLEHLKEKLKPYMLRRRTTDCLTDFPKKESKIVELGFSPEERALYQDVQTQILKGIDEARAAQVRQAQPMNLIGYLRQACNHCKLIDAELDIPSTKIQWIKELVATIQERDEKCVIFTEWKRMALILSKEFGDCPTLYGGIAFGRRHDILERWKESDEPLVTTDCSNVGLNLQQANWLINYEMHWNPAVMKQRAGRVWRLTQEKEVHIRAPMIHNSVEEEVLKTLAGKINLFKDVIDGIASEARKVSRNDRETT